VSVSGTLTGQLYFELHRPGEDSRSLSAADARKEIAEAKCLVTWAYDLDGNLKDADKASYYWDLIALLESALALYTGGKRPQPRSIGIGDGRLALVLANGREWSGEQFEEAAAELRRLGRPATTTDVCRHLESTHPRA
jgi:hypothetical protein